MKAIILAGGSGTRLDPVTRAVNKHLLPVYDRPMIFHALDTVRALGVREVLLIGRPQDIPAFQCLLADGAEHGLRLAYASQYRPNGLAEGLVIGAEFADGDTVALALGDNLFGGAALARIFAEPFTTGCRIFVREVAKPGEFAVLERELGRPVAITEKPQHPRSRWAVTGLYLFDDRAFTVAAGLRPSHRGEVEIVDVIRWYLEARELEVRELPPLVHWADLGTFDRLLDAGLDARERQR
jgi:glucose-1-phosphate thymidylyltransferase